ncbi:dienelactone hydrolase family protein [Streptomyces sp. NPDC001941]|uniref:dienelactone hydrolase family protein n=1 Tax=Streptomyces sp. NPDC001941 TaxID=3154659 RepID=UPI003320921E
MTDVVSFALDLSTPEGTIDCWVSHPDDGAPHPGVLYYADAFGPRPASLAMAERIAAEGYTVLLPNVFHREGRAPVVDLPDFIGPDERPALFGKLMPLMGTLSPERVVRDAAAYLDWFAGSPLATDGPVGLTGYCLGAGLALRTAAAQPGRVAAVGGFHGGNLAGDGPDSPHRLAKDITAELFLGHADNDSSMPPEQIAALDEALAEAGLTYRAEVFAGASHGYTQKDTSAYDAEADARHWRELLALFARTL